MACLSFREKGLFDVPESAVHNRKNEEKDDMVEKVVFAVMMIVAAGAGIMGCIYEIGGRRKANAESKSPKGEAASEGKETEER